MAEKKMRTKVPLGRAEKNNWQQQQQRQGPTTSEKRLFPCRVFVTSLM